MFFIILIPTIFICGLIWFVMSIVKIILGKKTFRGFLLELFLIILAIFLLYVWIRY